MSEAERRLVLPADLRSITAGRHFARDVMHDWELDELIDDVQLGTSELVTNAIQHAGTQVTLTVRRDTVVTGLVEDGVPELRQPSGPQLDPTVEHGRGLQIVAAISSDWGVTTAENGKCIWFSLALPDSNSADADVYSITRRADRAAEAKRTPSGGRREDDAAVSSRARARVAS